MHNYEIHDAINQNGEIHNPCVGLLGPRAGQIVIESLRISFALYPQQGKN